MNMNNSRPRLNVPKMSPNNYRDAIQNQIDRTVAQQLDEMASFGVNGDDGRTLYPSVTNQLRDPMGRKYHRVGMSTSDDFSVAGF